MTLTGFILQLLERRSRTSSYPCPAAACCGDTTCHGVLHFTLYWMLDTEWPNEGILTDPGSLTEDILYSEKTFIRKFVHYISIIERLSHSNDLELDSGTNC